MRRGIRIALAGTVAAGAVLVGAGTAYAHDDKDGHGDRKHDCPSKMDKDRVLREDEFPSDHAPEAFKNTTKKDAVDAHGKTYYLHNDVCSSNKPWRTAKDWDEYGDKSYDTFHYKFDKKTGWPSRDTKKNTYNTYNFGYNKELRKDKKNRKDLDRDKIGAPKSPANEPQ